MAKQYKAIRPNPSRQPRKNVFPQFPSRLGSGLRQKCPILLGEAAIRGKPEPANISMTKQTHHAPTNSNQTTYTINPKRRAATNAAQPAGEKSQNTAPPGTFWDIGRKQDARADGKNTKQTQPAARLPYPAQQLNQSSAQPLNG